MNQLWKLPFVLMITTLIAASALSLVNNSTKPLIEEHKRKAILAALKIVSPAGIEGVNLPVYEGETIDYYKCYANSDTTGLLGYVFTAYGVAYSSTIETMVGIDTSGIVKAITILDQRETPGLGTKILEVKYGEQEPWFQIQFKNKSADQILVDKDGGTIVSITGATISSRAVAKSIQDKIAEFEKKIGGFAKTPSTISKIIHNYIIQSDL